MTSHLSRPDHLTFRPCKLAPIVTCDQAPAAARGKRMCSSVHALTGTRATGRTEPEAADASTALLQTVGPRGSFWNESSFQSVMMPLCCVLDTLSYQRYEGIQAWRIPIQPLSRFNPAWTTQTTFMLIAYAAAAADATINKSVSF